MNKKQWIRTMQLVDQEKQLKLVSKEENNDKIKHLNR